MRNSNLTVLPGGRALSEFRADKLLAQMRARGAECAAAEARFVYFIDTRAALNAADTDRLRQLLPGATADFPPANGACHMVVTPRIGTISPWSSKATEIIRQCGLSAVRRVERGVEWRLHIPRAAAAAALEFIHDPMTESVLPDRGAARALFQRAAPPPVATVDILSGGLGALHQADAEFGFALSAAEQQYLVARFQQLGRNPTDAELMMFAQVNSEHCRHKIFNADWRVDGRDKKQTPMALIRRTAQHNADGILSAYEDNAALLEGRPATKFFADPASGIYAHHREPAHITIKVETHNHPTAVAPFPGAATGCGGEIRDAAACGRGAKPKAGIVGFAVSHLRLPAAPRPWEMTAKNSPRIAAPLQIMLEAPIGAAAFNNEFGRPNIGGYFRTFEMAAPNGTRYGYHKPILLAGGLGNIRPHSATKRQLSKGMRLIVLGGPAMRIGIGGGAASSMSLGDNAAELDFASVQRGNPEVQRRCQEVIDACCARQHNPIAAIHDVGAGGLGNALAELVQANGGEFELRDMLIADEGMTPMQIWCNESQERFVLAVADEHFDEFKKICAREKCLYKVVGRARDDARFIVRDRRFGGGDARQAAPIDVPMDLLFGLPPKMHVDATRAANQNAPLNLNRISVRRAAELVLTLPAVADKTFLIAIGDRSVGGLTARDQFVGPWQTPVADVGVTAAGYASNYGEAIAVGERPPLSLINAAAAARMAVGEAITNIAAARIDKLTEVKLSANWMAAADEPGQAAALYAAVEAATDFCQKLGVAIPMGKDSLAMKTAWREGARECKVVAPLSPVVTAFARVADIRATLTPQLNAAAANDIWLTDLGAGRNALGGSALAQVTAQLGDAAADVRSYENLRAGFELIQNLNARSLILAYHDRSDGGLFATLCEMAFAARCGLNIDIGALPGAALEILFNEELGMVFQTRRAARAEVLRRLAEFKLQNLTHRLGAATAGENIRIRARHRRYEFNRVDLHQRWSRTSWQMQRLRDNPACADAEYARIADRADSGLFWRADFDYQQDITAPYINCAARPKVAILREQGVNGHVEMAAAFDTAKFAAVDVTMQDLLAENILAECKGLAVCGGFSFGDVLGAGQGWAKLILGPPRLRDAFTAFFARADTFALGVCNGCQMLAGIAELIPGAAHWPRQFSRNTSEQFESRTAMVEIVSDQSIFLRGMQGARLPIACAHGEGRAELNANDISRLVKKDQLALRFVDYAGIATEKYPANPNGSPGGVTGFTAADGRVTILMPHPERVVRAVCNSWQPRDSTSREFIWGEYSPWMQMFRNARAWVD